MIFNLLFIIINEINLFYFSYNIDNEINILNVKI